MATHTVKFRVIGGVSQWGFTGVGGKDRVFAGSTEEPHEADFAKADLKYLAGGQAAGHVEIVSAPREARAQMSTHVESQADSETAWGKAWVDGSWLEGQLLQHAIDVKHGAPAGSVGGES